MENTIIRVIIFLILLVLLIIAETFLPKKARKHKRISRWFANGAMTLLNTLTLYLLNFALPLLAVGVAFDAQNNNWGLFNILTLPLWVEFILAFLILDFVIWMQHMITHKIPFLWRFHRVHHSDCDLDVTSALRFHPIEIALSMFLKIAVVYIIGPATIVVIIFEIALNGLAMFNHANLKLSHKIDKFLRLFIVTPDMHRIHHSVHRYEHDTNYGFALSIWDRLFHTYCPQPKDGHEDMTLGLLKWQDNKPTKLKWLLWLPFQK